MSIHKIMSYPNGFPLFSCSSSNNLKIGKGEKIIVSDLWSFWDYIVKKFIEKNNKNKSTEKILFSFLEQAKYFYQSGEKSPIKSQALLYYYSFLNLSKIAYIINEENNNKTIKDLKYTHGISEIYSNSFKTSKVSIKTSTKGAIQIAHKVLKFFDLDKAPQDDTKEHSFNVRDILSHCVGVHRAYSEIYEKPEFFIKIIDFDLFRNGKNLYFRGYLGNKLDDEDIKSLINVGYSIIKYQDQTFYRCLIIDEKIKLEKEEEHTQYESKNDGYYFFNKTSMNNYKISNKDLYNISKQIRAKGIWYFIGNNGYTMYLSKSDTANYRYSQESIIYMVMFFLGSITRYSPYLFDTLFSNKEQWLISEFLTTQPKQFLYLLTSHTLGQSVLKAYASF